MLLRCGTPGAPRGPPNAVRNQDEMTVEGRGQPHPPLLLYYIVSGLDTRMLASPPTTIFIVIAL